MPAEWSGEICKCCRRRNVIGFVVADDIWEAVHGPYNVLCPTCFDILAEEKGVIYHFLEVFPVTWSDWQEDTDD